MASSEIGLIGLGVMGSNLALNIAEHGFQIAVFNRTAAHTDEFMAHAGGLASRITPTKSLQGLVEAIRPPRPVIIMVKAGEAVDEQITALRPLLAAGDIIIDAGNANFRDTRRRFKDLSSSGITFIGMGVSGGEEGARHGPSIMVGSTLEAYARIEPVVTAIAARYDNDPCCARLGPDGAGHFVKTIHNGIEYADMQMIAEIYGLLSAQGMSAAEASDVFADWNKGRLNSYLIEITAKVLKAVDPRTGRPMVDVILDSAGQKGTGRWAVMEAQDLGVPATVMEAAVAARALSAVKTERLAAAKLFPFTGAKLPALQRDDLEMGLFAGKILAYAQGFAVMAAASRDYGWDLPMGRIAAIWRAGCIIRSQFLSAITSAYQKQPLLGHLVMAPDFAAMLKEALPALRRIVPAALAAGLPVPALASALTYLDGYRQERSTASLLQAQRDFFGAHGFLRVDEPGDHHGPWAS